MGKIKDITGVKFGRLTVIQPTDERRGRNICWLCKCDCGNEKVVQGHSLTAGFTKSCGCLKTESAKKTNAARRKHFGCLYCGSDKHYAKGYCWSCYMKARRGTLEQ